MLTNAWVLTSNAIATGAMPNHYLMELKRVTMNTPPMDNEMAALQHRARKLECRINALDKQVSKQARRIEELEAGGT